MAFEYHYISGDSHLEVDTAQWASWVQAEYRERTPQLVHLEAGDGWYIDGKLARMGTAADVYGGKGRENYVPSGTVYEGTPGTGPATQRLQEQDQDGIDAEVLFPAQQAGPRLWRMIPEDDAYRAVVRGYNDWLAGEYCATDPKRLIGVGILPMVEDVDAHIDEMTHCKEIGLKTVVLLDFPSGKTYPSAEDDRFWAAALDMEMPMTVHVDVDRSKKGPMLEYPSADPADRDRLEGNGRSFAEQVARFGPSRGSGSLAAAQWVLSGLFDRFPTLRILFAENQIGWIPFFHQGADVRYERNRHWAQRLLGFEPLSRPPSEYFLEHCLWGFQYDRVGVQMRDLLNVNHLLWGSDFPHQESDWPHSLDILDRAFEGAPEEVRHQMTCGNAIEFFKLRD